MFDYNSTADAELGEHEPLGGGAVGLRGGNKKRAFMIAGGTSALLLLLFAFSGSSGSVAAAKAAAMAAPAQTAVQQPVPEASVETATAAVAAVEHVAAGSAGIVFSVAQYDIIYNVLSLAIASMGSATVFFFFQFSLVDKEYKTALTITGLVTLIAFYHYIRIFNSFTDAYISQGGVITATGIPFNDAYRYVDWLLTVPLLLSELILVMGFDADESRKRCFTLGGAAALMVILGYPGEITDAAGTRWTFWALAMIPFLYIVYTLFFGLSASISKQGEAGDLVRLACYVTVVSWCFYPVVYIFPMLGLTGAGAHTAIQIGYSIADIVAKPLTGILVWMIAARKSAAAL